MSSARLGHVVPKGKDPTRQLVLYAADTPNSWKPATLLEEMGVEYDIVTVDIMANEQKEPAYLAMNPNGRTPALLDRSVSPPFAVFESNAILLYLATKYESPLLPKAAGPRSEVEQWLMWQISALGPMMGQCMYFKRIATTSVDDVAKLQFSIDRFHAECVRLLAIMDARLAQRDYLCGDGRGAYSLADIACWGYAASFFWSGHDAEMEGWPSLRRWIAAVGARQAVLAGARVPGVSVLGTTGVLFEDLRTDPRVQERLRNSAQGAGRPHFNWQDMKLLAGTPDLQIFSAQPEFKVTAPRSPSEPRGVGPPTVLLVGAACFLAGWLAHAARRTHP